MQRHHGTIMTSPFTRKGTWAREVGPAPSSGWRTPPPVQPVSRMGPGVPARQRRPEDGGRGSPSWEKGTSWGTRLSMDYHVFVVSRIREARQAGRTTRDAVVHGVVTTAGVVTSAAVI